MNQLLGAVCLFLAILLFLVSTFLWFHRRGFQHGKDQGYIDGRKAADNWWLGVEAEADQARVKIWREEERRRG